MKTLTVHYEEREGLKALQVGEFREFIDNIHADLICDLCFSLAGAPAAWLAFDCPRLEKAAILPQLEAAGAPVSTSSRQTPVARAARVLDVGSVGVRSGPYTSRTLSGAIEAAWPAAPLAFFFNETSLRHRDGELAWLTQTCIPPRDQALKCSVVAVVFFHGLSCALYGSAIVGPSVLDLAQRIAAAHGVELRPTDTPM
jgi:hypothetical protein